MTCSPSDLEHFTALAKEEICENGVKLPEHREKVKNILSEKYPKLRLPADIDNLIDRCLRLRKFEWEKAAAQVNAYFKFLYGFITMRKEKYYLPSIHSEYFFESLGVSVLKNRDSKGRIVFFSRWDKLPSATYDLDKGLACLFLILNELTRISVATQRLGIVFVCDFKGYEFAHAKQYTLSRLKTISAMFQGAIPVRFKAFHVLRSPFLFTYTYAMLKPFIGQKIRNRLHFHGSDLTEFHNKVSPEILPQFLGGLLPDDDYADLEFTRYLATKDDYYTELFRYGYFDSDEEAHNELTVAEMIKWT